MNNSDTLVTAVINAKTNRYFILIEESSNNIYKVINPAGEIMSLSSKLFEEEPLFYSNEEASTHFTPEQLAALETFNKKQDENDALRAKMEAKISSEQAVAKERPSSTRARRTPSSKLKPPAFKGVVSTWRANRLTFYKHQIEPLHPEQSFRIEIENVGTFEIKKKDFLSYFNEVIMSSQYKNDGYYTYKEIPDKAKKFFKE